jgi:CPA1 family monovalent cation:H+ antiporter
MLACPGTSSSQNRRPDWRCIRATRTFLTGRQSSDLLDRPAPKDPHHMPFATATLLAEDVAALIEPEILLLWLLVIITGVAMLVRRIKLPYTVALVIVGLILAALRIDIGLDVTSELILLVLVPPLIFESALHLNWHELRRDLTPVLLMAVPGVIIASLVVGGLVYVLLDIPFAYALAFGALISATDPVAVISFFRSLGVERRLSVLMEGESLLNDGVAIVLFSLALTLAGHEGESLAFVPAILEFLRVAFGGIAVGLIAGFAAAHLVVKRVDDHLIENTVTLALSIGVFVIAESQHLSGILAVVAAGIYTGTFVSRRYMSENTTTAIYSFWELLAYIVTSILFLLLGLRIDIGDLPLNVVPILVAIAAILFSRALVVYTVGRSSQAFAWRIPRSFSHVMYWGGLRGAISVALALSLSGPHAARLQVMTFGVVLFTLMVQGLSIEGLIRRLRLDEAAP